MPSFRSPESKAKKAIRQLNRIGQKKVKGVRGHADGIHSIGSLKRYEQALTGFARWREACGNRELLRTATLTEALEYLAARSLVVGQKTLDADRHALQKLLGTALAPVKALDRRNALATGSRAYSTAQVDAIAAHQSPPNALATRIAFACGLRAHELLTIQKQGNGSYTVVGKGGLQREINIPKQLERELENRRLETPATVTDRGIHYTQYYAIGGGQAFSQSFTDASQRALGMSHGAHGLRHSYAQERLAQYQADGQTWDEARLEVSKELGHFRPEITNKYLR
jgi:integrase